MNVTDAELDALVVMVESYVEDGWPRVVELIPLVINEARTLRAENERLRKGLLNITETGQHCGHEDNAYDVLYPGERV